MSDNQLIANFTLGDADVNGDKFVTGEMSFPESVTGVAFKIPVKAKVADGESHWRVVSDTLAKVGAAVSHTAEGFNDKK